ncbi:MAG: hypothetical protein ACQETH_07845 [Candidatus Rifleibacteriota bacterium]
MRLKKILIFIIFIGVTNAILSQDSSRWIRFPRHEQPLITRQELSSEALGGKTLEFKFETVPVKPLLRTINKYFPELVPQATLTIEIMDTGKETMFLEKLQLEAEKYNATASDTIASETDPETLF